MTTSPEPLEEPTAPAADLAELQPHKLSEDLQNILDRAEGRSITIEEIEHILRGRGVAMLILVLAAPFLIPVPGLSVPFGIAICVLGLRIALGSRTALPRFVRRRTVPHKMLERIVSAVATVVRRMERHIRPRMHFLRRHPRMVNLIGVAIISAGFILSLPLPIPFSNLFPALSILCLAAGFMERDGLLVLAGYGFGVSSWLYLALCWKMLVTWWPKFVHVLGDWWQQFSYWLH
jgi:hypothetical protein